LEVAVLGLTSEQKIWRGNSRIFVGHGFTGRGKTRKLSFRGRGLPEESVFSLAFVAKQIPRCARDDKKADFFRSLFSRAVKG
jgi:hypothetical protein